MTKGNGDQEVVSREHDKIKKKALEEVLEKWYGKLLVESTGKESCNTILELPM